MLAITPPPYFAVIFSSYKNNLLEGYAEMADKIKAPAKEQNGFLNMEYFGTDIVITKSYRKDEISILK